MSFQSWLANFQGPQVSASAPGQQPQGFGSIMEAAMGGGGFDQQQGAGAFPMFQGRTGPNPNPGFGGGGGVGGGFNQTGQGGISSSNPMMAGWMFGKNQKGPGLQPSRDPSYYMDMGQQFTGARDFLMSQTGAGGMLSESSMNPYTRQLAEGSAYAERERQQDMGYTMSAAGVNPLMAQRAIDEGGQYATEQLGSQFAQFEQDLMQRQFGAGAGLVDLSNALTSEMTARKEDQSRWADEYFLSDKHGTAMAKAAKDASKSDMFGSMMGLAGTAMMFSDRRLKKDIRRIGTHPIGVGIYEFSYKWENVKRIGVMADEVARVRPDLVTDPAVYLMVDYGKL